ncbi:MAG: hypothetical protein ACRD2O_05390, partial [Terriglobia bacterium]
MNLSAMLKKLLNLWRKDFRWHPHLRWTILGAAAIVLFLAPSAGMAQGLTPAALLNPATDTWPTYNGDYSGRRYSTLDQINASNVGGLRLAWVFETHTQSIKSTALEV